MQRNANGSELHLDLAGVCMHWPPFACRRKYSQRILIDSANLRLAIDNSQARLSLDLPAPDRLRRKKIAIVSTDHEYTQHAGQRALFCELELAMGGAHVVQSQY